MRRYLLAVLLALVALAPDVLASGPPTAGDRSTPERSEREQMYDRYLEFSSLIKGGSITPRWGDDGSSFTYAEAAAGETVTYRVDPRANTVKRLGDDSAPEHAA